MRHYVVQIDALGRRAGYRTRAVVAVVNRRLDEELLRLIAGHGRIKLGEPSAKSLVVEADGDAHDYAATSSRRSPTQISHWMTMSLPDISAIMRE